MTAPTGTLSHGELAGRIVSERFAGAYASVTAIKAVGPKERSDGQLFVCLDPPAFYVFDADSTATGDDSNVLTPATGTGRFKIFGGSGGGGGGTNSRKTLGCKMATQAALAAYTRTGNVLLADANGALAAIDGVTPVVGDKVLVKDGAAGADNGVYVIDSLGGASAKWQFTRLEGYDTSAEVTDGDIIVVEQGTVNADQVFRLTTNEAITLNTTALSYRRELFVQVASRTIGHADLTAMAMTQTIAFAAALPASAVHMGSYTNITEAFSDGMGSATTFDFGYSGTADAFIDGGDADGSPGRVGTPLGAVHGGAFVGGQTPAVKFDSDVNVDTFTTGAGTWYEFYMAPGL